MVNQIYINYGAQILQQKIFIPGLTDLPLTYKERLQ